MAANFSSPLAATAPATSGTPQWRRFTDLVFRHFTPDTGLPFTGATAIAQDRHGFLWVGSQSGLARWDGQRFRLYRAADRETGLPDNLIKVLHVDPRGRLWVGTNAGGIARYDAAADRFIAYGIGAQGLSHAGVRAIADDGLDGLWVATAGGLDHLDPDRRIIRRYRHAAARPDSLPADRVSALLPGANRGLWVGTEAGLALLDPIDGRFHRYLIAGRGTLDQPAVTSLAENGDGNFWIGTAVGAYRFDVTTGVATPVLDHGKPIPAPTGETVGAIARAGNSEVWIATAGGGVVIVEAATGATRRLVHDASIPSSLADDAPVALFRDCGGALWVGTQRALSRYDPTRTGIWTLWGGARHGGSLFNPDVTAVLGASDGRVWLGQPGGKVDILDPSRGTLTALAKTSRSANAPRATIAALAELPGGRVIIGTNAGLYESDRSGATLAPFGFRGFEQTRGVTALFSDGPTLWIGRLDGLWRTAIDRVRIRSPVRSIESDRLSDQRVMSIARGPDGSLWIGTQNGLNRLAPGTGRAEPVRLNGTRADGLVPTVIADRQGRMWAGVYGQGLAVITRRQGGGWTIRHIGVAQGLPDSNVDKLLEDSAGRIWASTDDGMAMIDPASFAVRAFKRPEGVAIAAYWSGSGARTAAGQLVYGGLGGATIIDPQQVAPALPQAPLMLTALRIGGSVVPEASFNDRSGHTITVEPDANSLFAEFAALDYAEPAMARYAYRLRGYQDRWIDADADHRSASYTNLPPGHYVLELRALPMRAGLRPIGLDIPVTVRPAWYQTLWFRLALAALCACLTAAVVHLRTAVLRRRQRELEQLVADRTAALRASQRDLEQIAYIDVLTGLPNRRMFNDQFRACLERADCKGNSVALLLIDLDRFKTINDQHGHDAGDALLVEVAVRLQAAINEHDSLARLGGDEFVIVVPDAEGRRVEDICRRITRSLAEPVQFGEIQIRSGASIGIATYKRDGTKPAELYKAADLALYAAKGQGRGTWAWFSEELATLAGGGG